ncbi:MAG: hypothetical protein C4527_17205 [Candidatus Omnitrophota bacterium]|nr:MAG: hypothetical protein C4527_17205 [Candidatus Omnitrophota bacterium]
MLVGQKDEYYSVEFARNVYESISLKSKTIIFLTVGMHCLNHIRKKQCVCMRIIRNSNCIQKQRIDIRSMHLQTITLS